METIKVNMNPNPLDVQTIHASQNDGEAREWGFELHNNGDVIDSSEISDQLVFKAYKGGTEQLLPENGSTPTTSPFKGDIRYPQGLLNDQEFTYRQSPTEEDGLAKITDIKGNTLVWNQLIQNGNFESTSNWNATSCSFTVSNKKATAKASNNIDQFGIYPSAMTLAQNHKYLITFKVTLYGSVRVSRNKIDSTGNTGRIYSGTYATIENAGSTSFGLYRFLYAEPVSDTTNDYYTLENAMLIDLTQMGLDITDPSEFPFSLPYYAYNQGTLLSFMGNGIKTVGFNQWDEEWEAGGYNVNGEKIADNTRIRSKNLVPLISGLTYYFKSPIVVGVRFFDKNKVFLGTSYNIANDNFLFTVPSNASYLCFSVTNTTSYGNNICINISSSKNGTYEPYTSSTLSLPISTYFPDGMNGVGTDYDELTNTKATTRMARVDLGTLDYVYDSTVPRFYTSSLNNIIKKPSTSDDMGEILCGSYQTLTVNQFFAQARNMTTMLTITGNVSFINTDYTSASTFKSAMSGVYLVYPLATPTETSFTTASLVTENAEIPLSNNDGVLVGKCTEQLSENPGFIDAKIKLSDADGECYSNKLQLHIERKPS